MKPKKPQTRSSEDCMDLSKLYLARKGETTPGAGTYNLRTKFRLKKPTFKTEST